VLEEIRKFIGCGIVHALGRRKSHWKDAWLYNAGGGKNTYYILENVVDKLIVKKEVAVRVMGELKIRLKNLDSIKKLKVDRIKKAKLLREQKWSYRKIAKELKTDFGYVRRLIISEK
ncbi:MAG: hypothetical protein AAB602_01070, partial [Patescibacteria group bacterium]